MSANSVLQVSRATAFLEALDDGRREKRLQILLHLSAQDTSLLDFLSAVHDQKSLDAAYLVDMKSSELSTQSLDLEAPFQVLSLPEAIWKFQKKTVDVLLLKPEQIACNGDAFADSDAFTLAVLAKYSDIPLYLIADTTTMKPAIPGGGTLENEMEVGKAVIPADLTHAIVTERGVLRSGKVGFDVASFIHRGNDVSSHDFSEFFALTEETAIEYVQANPSIAEKVGPPGAHLKCREAGDGNINYVYIVEGPKGGLVVKQGLPYIRVVGESWPLTQDRLRIEANWIKEQNKISPQHVPALYLLDERMSLIVMEYLAPPFQPLRSGILAGKAFPKMPGQVAEFLARSLFFTSALALKSDVYRAKIKEFHNPELCLATEQVIFMDAYYDAPTNAYLKPEMEDIVSDLRKDAAAKVAIGCLRNLFLSRPQALIHSDFHTGSVMVKEDAIAVFDSEFAFYGPMGFDVGKFLGNLLLAYFALDGHAMDEQPRDEQQEWLLGSVIQVWEGFCENFLQLWNTHTGMGDAYPEPLIRHPEEAFSAIQGDFMDVLFRETLGFAGACMIRRIVTIAQILDYTTIQDRAIRVVCSTRALQLGRRLLVNGMERGFSDIRKVVQEARKLRSLQRNDLAPVQHSNEMMDDK